MLLVASVLINVDKLSNTLGTFIIAPVASCVIATVLIVISSNIFCNSVKTLFIVILSFANCKYSIKASLLLLSLLSYIINILLHNVCKYSIISFLI